MSLMMHFVHHGHDPIPDDSAASAYVVANVVMVLEKDTTDSDHNDYYDAYAETKIPSS